MKEIIKLGLILLLISAIAATLLAVTNEMTKDVIQEQRDMASQQARMEVLPTAEDFEEITGDELSALQAVDPTFAEGYKGLAGGEVVGYVFKTLPGAFGGPIEIVTGVSVDGTITGVRMGSHNETPGLGAKAKDEPFYSQYTGQPAKALEVSKTESGEGKILAISGATITTDGVTDGVNVSIKAFETITE